MALGKYQDVYKLSQLEPRVKDIIDALQIAQGEQVVQSMEERVKNQISLLEKREQVIYTYLHIPENERNIKGLNKHLDKYRRAVINLSGPRLQSEITGILEKDLGEKFKVFEDKVNEIVQQELLPRMGKDLPNEFSKAYLQFLNDGMNATDLHQAFEKTGNYFSSTKALDEITNRVLVGALTPHQRKAWEKILGMRSGANSKDIDISINNNTIHFNWLKETDELTPSEAYKQPISWRKQVSSIIKQRLIDLVAVDNRKAFEEVLDYILRETDDTAFFVGKNVKDIIGLCGEIQATYYLYCFLGCDLSTLGNEIQWMGGKHIGENGQKPHRDALLQIFGIQVKNSVKSEIGTITFQDASVETILNKIDISPEIRNLLENYYGTWYFNIGYNIENGVFVHDQLHPLDTQLPDGRDGPTVYLETYHQLETYARDIEKLMAYSAAALLYMDIARLPGQLDANSLYLLGGATFYAASNILNKILELLKSNNNALLFNTFRTKMGRSDDSRTIVDALNDNTRAPNYSEKVLKKVILTSSFNFGSLVDQL